MAKSNNSGVPPATRGISPWNSAQAKASEITLDSMKKTHKVKRFGHGGNDSFVWKATCPTLPTNDPDLMTEIRDFVGGLFRLGDIRKTADKGYWPNGLVFVHIENPSHRICVNARQLNEVH